MKKMIPWITLACAAVLSLPSKVYAICVTSDNADTQLLQKIELQLQPDTFDTEGPYSTMKYTGPRD